MTGDLLTVKTFEAREALYRMDPVEGARALSLMRLQNVMRTRALDKQMKEAKKRQEKLKRQRRK